MTINSILAELNSTHAASGTDRKRTLKATVGGQTHSANFLSPGRALTVAGMVADAGRTGGGIASAVAIKGAEKGNQLTDKNKLYGSAAEARVKALAKAIGLKDAEPEIVDDTEPETVAPVDDAAPVTPKKNK